MGDRWRRPMRPIKSCLNFLILLIALLACGSGKAPASDTHTPTSAWKDALVTLKPPYLDESAGVSSRMDAISLGSAVRAVCIQVGMGYNSKQSYLNIGSTLERWIQPEIRNVKWEEAMSELLGPFNLAYTVEDNEIVLKRPESAGKGKDSLVRLKPPFPVWLAGRGNRTGRIQIIRAVEAVCEQAGFGFNRDKSIKNTGPLWAYGVRPDFENQIWGEAMKQILEPFKLSYVIEEDAISLVRGGTGVTGKEAPVTLKPPYTQWKRRFDAPADWIKIARAVMVVSAQAGFEYDARASQNNIGVFWKKEVQPVFENITWGEAMEQLLRPYNLTYFIENGVVTLVSTVKGEVRKEVLVSLKAPYNAWDEGKRIISDRIRLSHAVNDICEQAGFQYSWKGSANNIGRLWKVEVQPVFENITWEEGMKQILDPHNLTYVVEGDIVMLVRGQSRVVEDFQTKDSVVTLKPPYIIRKDGEEIRSDTMRLTHAVSVICRQAGFRYNWKESGENISNSLRRKEVRPVFENVTLKKGMEEILAPFGITYTIEGNKVTLVMAKGGKSPDGVTSDRRPKAGIDVSRRVSLKPPFSGWNPNKQDPGDKIAVIDAVNAVCRQAGISHDFEKSRENTRPLCDKKISPVIDRSPWDAAMLDILDPLGLDYTLDDGTVVLRKR